MLDLYEEITSRYSGANISGLKSGNGFVRGLWLIGPFPAKETHFNGLIQHGSSDQRVFLIEKTTVSVQKLICILKAYYF